MAGSAERSRELKDTTVLSRSEATRAWVAEERARQWNLAHQFDIAHAA